MRLDLATRVSRKGAVTWWHLDDSGEHVFQVGLPLKTKSGSKGGSAADGSGASGGGGAGGDDDDQGILIGPGGSPIVKLFIFAEVDAYDVVFQDGETNATGSFAALDPFDTPQEAVPCADGGGRSGDGSADGSEGRAQGGKQGKRARSLLPRFWVAPLEAGGPPLLSPPNMPHMVLTVS